MVWIAAAVVIGALALVAQAAFLWATYKAVRSIRRDVSNFLPRAQSALANAEKTLDESRQHIQQVSARANQVLDLTHTQLERIDEIVGEATTRARVQMDKIEGLLDDSVGRVHHAVKLVNESVTRPIREINAVSAGLRAAFGSLFRSSRSSVAQATADEEMFI
jgi:ABC-type transporter Mla subunit MlaD